MIDRYEKINQVNLIYESIKYEIGSLPKELLSCFHHTELVAQAGTYNLQ